MNKTIIKEVHYVIAYALLLFLVIQVVSLVKMVVLPIILENKSACTYVTFKKKQHVFPCGQMNESSTHLKVIIVSDQSN